MTEKDFETVRAYVRHLADSLSLRDWAFHIVREPAAPDAYASTLCTPGRKQAYLRFGWDFRSLSPQEQRHTVVHELLHCHFAPPTDFICLDLEQSDGLSDHEHDGVAVPFRRLMEYGIDGVADGISALFPLIDWGAGVEP